MLDNLIADRKIVSLIVVCATFDAENRAQSFSRSTEELLVFHNDLRENLIPHIEAKYSTPNSREHRAFGGRYYSDETTLYLEDVVHNGGWREDNFYIWEGIGTEGMTS